MKSNVRFWIPWLVVPISVAVAIGCGGGGGGGGNPPPPGCTADTTDIGDGSGTILSGVVRNESGALVPNAIVQFYNAGGTLLKNALTSCTGAYSVNMSDIPARVSLQNASIQSVYYKQFQYSGVWYVTGTSTCRAPLSGLNIGGTNTLPTIYLQTKNTPPPPPPTGCL